jgi:hypothetical protein
MNCLAKKFVKNIKCDVDWINIWPKVETGDKFGYIAVPGIYCNGQGVDPKTGNTVIFSGGERCNNTLHGLAFFLLGMNNKETAEKKAQEAANHLKQYYESKGAKVKIKVFDSLNH